MTGYREFADLETRAWSDASIASGYVDRFAEASDMAVPAVVSMVEPGARRVLDLCCGQGNVTRALVEAGHEVTGADFSEAMLDHARDRVAGAEFVRADAQDLPFGDDSFDAVTCSFGLMHVPDQAKALAEIARVLKPGGHLVMTAWCGPDVSASFAAFYSSVREQGDPSVKMPDSPDFHRFANPERAAEALGDAGFEVLTQDRVECGWTLTRPEQLAEIFERGAPRGGWLMKQQPERNRKAIREAVAEKVRTRFAEGDAFHAPMPAALIVART